MSVKIRMKRFGAKRRPYYRIIAIDSRSPRNGRTLEELGYYHPIVEDEEQQVKLKEEKIREWISKGARPSATVKKLLNKQNITIR